MNPDQLETQLFNLQNRPKPAPDGTGQANFPFSRVKSQPHLQKHINDELWNIFSALN